MPIGASHTTDQSGVSIVELLVAFSILAITLTALAGALISNVQHLTNTERETVATATALELIERLQSLPWEQAAVYEADMADSSADGTRWSARVTSGTFDGLSIVSIPGPFGADDRDELVPMPWFRETRQGSEYVVDLYPVFVDLDGDGSVDSKRFIAVASWTDRFGNSRELRVEAERAPSQAEASSTSTGARVLSFRPAPTIVALDEEGATTVDITLTARFSTGIAQPKATLTVVTGTVDNGDGTLTVSTAPQEVAMTPATPATDGGWTTASVVLHAGSVRLINGGVDITLEADLSGTVTPINGQTSLTATGGPFAEGSGTDEPPTPEPTPTPTPTPSPTVDYGGDLSINSLPQISTICVNSGNWKLTQPLTIRAQIDRLAGGVDDAWGTATVSYPYWSKKNKKDPGAPDSSGTIALIYSGTGTTWTGTIPAGGTHLFAPGEQVAFIIAADRDDGQAALLTSGVQPVKSC